MYFTPTRRRLEKGKWLYSITLIMLLLLAAACKPVNDQEGEEDDNGVDEPKAVVTAPPQEDPPEENEAYPPPQIALPEENEAYPPPPVPEPIIDPDAAYPPPQELPQPPEAYPGSTDEAEGIILSFERPIKPGSTAVTGDGPPGLFIYIMNVTLMGKLEGSGNIGDDGRFSINVSPLEENIRLGVSTDNAIQGLPEVNVRPGEGEFNVPQVGYFYDTVVVR